MKLYQEMRIQAIMLASTAVGLVGVLGLLLAGLIKNHMPYMYGAAALLLVVLVIVSIGQHWTQKTMTRVKKIREGGGDAADLEWLKTRNK